MQRPTDCIARQARPVVATCDAVVLGVLLPHEHLAGVDGVSVVVDAAHGQPLLRRLDPTLELFVEQLANAILDVRLFHTDPRTLWIWSLGA